MVDVSAKPRTARQALARGAVVMAPETLALCLSGRPKRAMCSPRPASQGSWRPSARMS